MTREEAIEIIECGDISNRWGDEGKEVERMVIQALKQQPSECTEHSCLGKLCRYYKQPCEDEGIAVKSITTAFQFGMALGFAKKYDEINKVMEEVKKAVTPQPKTGHWINIDDAVSECSECGHREPNERFVFEDINFCAKCGAKMRRCRR